MASSIGLPHGHATGGAPFVALLREQDVSRDTVQAAVVRGGGVGDGVRRLALLRAQRRKRHTALCHSARTWHSIILTNRQPLYCHVKFSPSGIFHSWKHLQLVGSPCWHKIHVRGTPSGRGGQRWATGGGILDSPRVHPQAAGWRIPLPPSVSHPSPARDHH